MQKRIILHSDLNNFFASVECLHHPEIRDKPVAVCGDPEARHGIVLAKNEKAKAFGIKTAETIREAKNKCPGLVIVPPNYHLYLQYANMAREIYGGFTDQIEPFGIDESWMDVTRSTKLFGDGRQIADKIRERIRKEMGITVSVGVADNKIFAKLGSDMKKPDATTVIESADMEKTIWRLPVGDLLYVGTATASKLFKMGIYTIGDLAMADRAYLRSRLGKWGDVLWEFANGYDKSVVSLMGAATAMKSIGNSLTTPRDLLDEDDVKMAVWMLTESVAARLRKHSFRCRTVEIWVRDNKMQAFTRQAKLNKPSQLAAVIAPLAMDIFRRNYKWERPIRSLGVRGADLCPAAGEMQLSMLEEEEWLLRQEALENTMDDIRRRYGHFSIQRGMMLVDRHLTQRNPKDDHVNHPGGFYNPTMLV